MYSIRYYKDMRGVPIPASLDSSGFTKLHGNVLGAGCRCTTRAQEALLAGLHGLHKRNCFSACQKSCSCSLPLSSSTYPCLQYTSTVRNTTTTIFRGDKPHPAASWNLPAQNPLFQPTAASSTHNVLRIGSWTPAPIQISTPNINFLHFSPSALLCRPRYPHRNVTPEKVSSMRRLCPYSDFPACMPKGAASMRVWTAGSAYLKWCSKYQRRSRCQSGRTTAADIGLTVIQSKRPSGVTQGCTGGR
ncbi:hypothetical protein GGR55DRAFT_176763 [Xylaria sp. FL0064]|nr:hypothetical protein GGR55DRAFT_176763 [Xylaria sp. FL0064]